MPEAKLVDVSLHYRLDGPENAPVLILSNSLGTALEMWNAQIPMFTRYFRVLRYDTRGHGRSTVPPGPYTMDRLGRDVIGLLNTLNIAKANYCGISMGGMTGIWLGIHAADRLDHLVLCDTAAKLGTTDSWNERITKVKIGGMNAIISSVMERWFTQAFRQQNPAECTAIQAMLNTTAPIGYAACCEAIRDMDLSPDLQHIRASTLMVAGSQDLVTPPEMMHNLAKVIPNAKLQLLEAAHLSNIEAADDFTSSVLDFLKGDGSR